MLNPRLALSVVSATVATASAAFAAIPSNEPESGNLLAYYNYDSSATLNSTGNTLFNATQSSDSTTAAGQLPSVGAAPMDSGNALFLNGTNQSLNIPVSHNTATSTFSISAWFNANTDATSASRRYVFEGKSTYDISFGTASSGTNSYVTYDGAASGTSKTVGVLAPNVWHNVVESFAPDGAGNEVLTVYIDGSALSGTVSTSLANISFPSFNLGSARDGSQRFFSGYIDEVGVWNTSLNSTDVAAIYSQGVPEPVSLSGLGLIGAAALRRRRMSK